MVVFTFLIKLSQRPPQWEPILLLSAMLAMTSVNFGIVVATRIFRGFFSRERANVPTEQVTLAYQEVIVARPATARSMLPYPIKIT